MPDVYFVNARGERVPDGDATAAYVINPNDSAAAWLLERLQGAGNEATARVVEGIKAKVPVVAVASERHQGAAARIRQIAETNRRTREVEEAKRQGTYVDPESGARSQEPEERLTDNGNDTGDGQEASPQPYPRPPSAARRGVKR